MYSKIVLIGAGMVGTSFIYSAIHEEVADKYCIIDLNNEFAKGHILDLEDVIFTNKKNSIIKLGDYSDCKDASIIIITAGRAQKEGESRLDMIKENGIIIKKIANNIKNSGFSGISIIVSNPVDCMAYIYQKETNFPYNKVISTGCSLDTIRFKIELSKFLKISANDIEAYVIGEHGDSSVVIFSNILIKNIPISNLQLKTKQILHKNVINKAYEIIKRKKATYYGIGSILSQICKSIILDLKTTISVGKYLNGEYGEYGIYISIPCIIGKNGIEKSITFSISKEEKKNFSNSVKKLKSVIFSIEN